MPLDDKIIAKVIRRIMAEHVGKENAVKGVALFYQVSVAMGEKISERKIRDVIDHQLGNEIGSVGAGYFKIRDDEEAAQVIRYYGSYICAFSKRRKAILDKYPDAAQGTLPL
jgi:hypothetical protein